ncbi:MAG: glycerol-3-phosphate 1-O-acyltransferase PlsY [Clostridia bacterium]|nr:glycerol-3-phosphate 1-O-acyltransferase PlsY [Clostridia bacterium]
MEALKEILRYSLLNHLYGTKTVEVVEELELVRFELPWRIMIPALIILFIVGYFLGSINFATIISKKKYNDDVRQHGSGNAGMTNMMRTYGKKAAALTLLGDALKAMAAVFLGMFIIGQPGAYIAGLGTIIGHTWPIYYNFKGGKGVVTAITTILCTEPLVGVLLLVIFVLIVWMTKYISLGSVMCSLIYPFLLLRLSQPELIKTIVCFCITALLFFNHRQNIIRLYNREENKFSFKKSVPTADKK